MFAYRILTTYVPLHIQRIGTNDCGQKLTVPTIETNANSLLEHLFAAAPHATVYMASMIAFPRVPVCSQEFNLLVPGIVAKHKAKGMKIYYTPMEEWSGVCSGNATDDLSGLCCSGEVHPTAAGYLCDVSTAGATRFNMWWSHYATIIAVLLASSYDARSMLLNHLAV